MSNVVHIPGGLCFFLLVSVSGCGVQGCGAENCVSDSDTDSDSGTDTGIGTDSGDPPWCEELSCSGQCVRYVDVSSAAAGDGLSWVSAFTRVQDGIDSASQWVACCDDVCQVWIAEGRYYVYESGPDDTVSLSDRVQLYGGFSGDEEALEQRDLDSCETILDGRAGPESEKAVYHVLSAISPENEESMEQVVLDGLVVTHGEADGDIYSTEDSCAGLFWEVAGDPIVRNCRFESNRARNGGNGACFHGENSYPLVERCSFVDNQGCDETQEGFGGGISLASVSGFFIDRCVFQGNSASHGAAFFSSTDGIAAAENCIFVQNDGISDIVEFIPYDFMFGWGGNAFLYNSIFYKNTLPESPPPENTPVVRMQTIYGKISNNIIWQNTSDLLYYYMSEYNIADVYPEEEQSPGCIYADPLFVDPDGGDFHLQLGSPAIDAAHGDVAPELDFEDRPRVDIPGVPNTGAGAFDYADIGAFEYHE